MPVLVSRRGVAASPIASRAVRARAERMLQALRLPRATLSVLLCDDALMHTLNRTHRGKNKPTDVLAFAMREGEAVVGDANLLGDIVISIPTAARQARSAKRPVWDETTMLLAHGLLHLLGFDHRDDAEERRMKARTDMLCAAAVPATKTPRARRSRAGEKRLRATR